MNDEMKNVLMQLMSQFGVLGMEPEAVGNDNGLEFPNASAEEEEVEYDEEGNPIPKAKPLGEPGLEDELGGEPAPESSCGCDHAEAPALDPMQAPEAEEDEFDFDIR